MSYPNYYGGYQPPYYQPPVPDQLAQLRQPYQPMQQSQQMQQGRSMIWVNGEQEAMGYLVAPNSAVALWDSTSPTIYLKQADASGKPSIKVYDLVERSAAGMTVTAHQSGSIEYATKEQLDALAARVDALIHKETVSKEVVEGE